MQRAAGGKEQTVLLTWALHVLHEHVESELRYEELESVVLAVRKHGSSIVNQLNNPTPFPYYHTVQFSFAANNPREEPAVNYHRFVHYRPPRYRGAKTLFEVRASRSIRGHYVIPQIEQLALAHTLDLDGYRSVAFELVLRLQEEIGDRGACGR